MTQADPWDETSRLEKQMEAELLAKLEDSGLTVSRTGPQTEKTRSETSEPRHGLRPPLQDPFVS